MHTSHLELLTAGDVGQGVACVPLGLRVGIEVEHGDQMLVRSRRLVAGVELDQSRAKMRFGCVWPHRIVAQVPLIDDE